MILVLAELENGTANEVSLETLALARSLGSESIDALGAERPGQGERLQ